MRSLVKVKFKDESGSVTIEIAIFLPLLVMILLGGYDLYRVIQGRAMLDHMSQQLTRSDYLPEGLDLTPFMPGNIAVLDQNIWPITAGGEVEVIAHINPGGIPCAPNFQMRLKDGKWGEMPLRIVTLCLQLEDDIFVSGFIRGSMILMSSHSHLLSPLRGAQ